MSVRPRTASLVAIATVAVAVGVIVLVGRASTPEPVPGGAGGGAGSTSGTTSAASPGTVQRSPATTGRPSPSARPDQPDPTGPSPTGPSPTGPLGEAASPRTGPGPDDQPDTGRAAAPLLDHAPDQTEWAERRIVGSFPEALRPSSSGRVVSSSVAPSGRRVQASLVVRDRSTARQVLRRYHLRLAAHGFTESSVRSVPGSTGAVFRNGPESVVVTVTGGRRPSYSVVASLLAG